ncbi:MAG TPA: hypothetical protein VGQ42_05750 [Candidatus Dormibacteraeota bacterium]|nr:hypothetical protein [Candidatus Dormibacteraeota bacterium]
MAHSPATEQRVRPQACPLCRTPMRCDTMEMVLSTNRGYRFPAVDVLWCSACRQAVWVELDHYPKECGCGARLETDLADHAAVPCERQLVSVVFESCARCGQVREVYLNH